MAFYNLSNKSFGSMLRLNATGKNESNFWSNATGISSYSECESFDDDGCWDKDGDYHYDNEIGTNTTANYPATTTTATNTSSGGGGFWTIVGNVLQQNAGSIFQTGLGYLNQGNINNQTELEEAKLAAIKAQMELNAQQNAQQNAQKAADKAASNKWIYPALFGVGIVTVGSILYIVFRNKKASA